MENDSPDEDVYILPITAELDLHPFRPKEVKSVVEEYLLEAKARGFHEVRIVHGKGIGVQREIVQSVLKATPFVKNFIDAPPWNGGRGATIVELEGPEQ